MDDRDMLRYLKRDLRNLFKPTEINADFDWRYDKNGGDKPPDLRMNVTLEFTIPEDNMDIAMRELDEIKNQIDRLTDTDGQKYF